MSGPRQDDDGHVRDDAWGRGSWSDEHPVSDLQCRIFDCAWRGGGSHRVLISSIRAPICARPRPNQSARRWTCRRWCRWKDRDKVFSFSCSGGLWPPQTCIQMQGLDFALIRLLCPVSYQTGTNRIFNHIEPFFRIRFSWAQDMVEKSFLPMRRSYILKSQCPRQKVFQTFDPVGKIFRRWRQFYKQMNMIGHQNIPTNKKFPF